MTVNGTVSSGRRMRLSSSSLVAVKKIERGVEGDDAAVGVGDVDAGFFDAADVHVPGVEELHDDDAEEVVVAEVCRDFEFRQAAEEVLLELLPRMWASGRWKRF